MSNTIRCRIPLNRIGKIDYKVDSFRIDIYPVGELMKCLKIHLRIVWMFQSLHGGCSLDEGVLRGKLVLNLFVHSRRPVGWCNSNAIIISLLLYNWETAVNETSWDSRATGVEHWRIIHFICQSFNWRELAGIATFRMQRYNSLLLSPNEFVRINSRCISLKDISFQTNYLCDGLN